MQWAVSSTLCTLQRGAETISGDDALGLVHSWRLCAAGEQKGTGLAHSVTHSELSICYGVKLVYCGKEATIKRQELYGTEVVLRERERESLGLGLREDSDGSEKLLG